MENLTGPEGYDWTELVSKIEKWKETLSRPGKKRKIEEISTQSPENLPPIIEDIPVRQQFLFNDEDMMTYNLELQLAFIGGGLLELFGFTGETE